MAAPSMARLPRETRGIISNMVHLRRDSHSNTYRNRLIFRSWHRGTQESDFLLGSFADSCLSGLDEDQLRRFEALLDCSDPDLFDWILGASAPPAEHNHDVLHLLRAYWTRQDDAPLEKSPIPSAT
jgi:antitoxin CptB